MLVGDIVTTIATRGNTLVLSDIIIAIRSIIKSFIILVTLSSN